MRWNEVNSSLIVGGMSTAAFPLAGPAFGTARHPFRATLPLRALRALPQFEPEVRLRMEEVVLAPAPAEPAPRRGRGLRFTAQEVREFLLAYVACFMAVSAWLG